MTAPPTDRSASDVATVRVVPISREELRYSTGKHVALEQRVLERASLKTGAGLDDQRDVDAAIVARPTLSPEQRELVERLCLDGDLVGVVAGRAREGEDVRARRASTTTPSNVAS